MCKLFLSVDAANIFWYVSAGKRNPNRFTAVNPTVHLKDLPIELMDLTYVEQLFIARVEPVIRVYRVKSRGFPGKYAYKGNIINIGQNITEIVSSLPSTSASQSTIVVRKEVLMDIAIFM